jgi:hypothetical protein
MRTTNHLTLEFDVLKIELVDSHQRVQITLASMTNSRTSSVVSNHSRTIESYVSQPITKAREEALVSHLLSPLLSAYIFEDIYIYVCMYNFLLHIALYRH